MVDSKGNHVVPDGAGLDAQRGVVDKRDALVAHQHSRKIERTFRNKQVGTAANNKQRRTGAIKARNGLGECFGAGALDDLGRRTADAQRGQRGK